MGLDEITGEAEKEHDADKLEDYVEQMDEHVDEIERLQNMVVAFSSRLEQLEDRLSVMEQMLASDDASDDEFLEGEVDVKDDDGYSWQ